MSESTDNKKQLEKQLRSACEYDEIEKVRKLLHDGVDPNSCDERVSHYIFLISETNMILKRVE